MRSLAGAAYSAVDVAAAYFGGDDVVAVVEPHEPAAFAAAAAVVVPVAPFPVVRQYESAQAVQVKVPLPSPISLLVPCRQSLCAIRSPC